MVEISKNVNNRSWMFGDYDRDGVKNIDDPKPLDPKIKHPNDKRKGYYNKSQFIGGEVKLSSVLRKIERHNNQFSPLLNKTLRENPNSYGRIKTVPSTINKLQSRYIKRIGDIGGATIIVRDKKAAFKKERELSHKYNFDITKRDNYYKHPKGNVYRAIHNKILLSKGSPIGIELQIKSKARDEWGKDLHPYYKKYGSKLPKKLKRKFVAKDRKLFNLGF